MCFVSFLCVSEVEVVMSFCSFLYLSMAGMLYTIIPYIIHWAFWHPAPYIDKIEDSDIAF